MDKTPKPILDRREKPRRSSSQLPRENDFGVWRQLRTELMDSVQIARLVEVCHPQLFEFDDCICLGDHDNAKANRSSFGADRTGFEAFVNHIHPGDLWEGDPGAPGVESVRSVSMIIIASWAIALLPVLRGRSVLFFSGGSTVEDFAVRFHVDRGSSDTWADISDAAFLTSSGLAVWRFDVNGLKTLHDW